MKNFNQLNRVQMKNIIGGVKAPPGGGGTATVTADCGSGGSVTCTGTSCTSDDGNGCTCIRDDGSHDSKECA